MDSNGFSRGSSKGVSGVSRKLALGVRTLAETLGYATTICLNEPACKSENGNTEQKNVYTVKIINRDVYGSDELHHFYEVKTISETGKKKKVYNLTVDEDNSYTADGIVVHNCQDMSIAGKREGLSASRSGLFFEAVRIVKEMRESTNGEKPRYIVWENVPGAFSSNKGEDFRCVLEEICKVKEAGIHIPEYSKWTQAGEIVGDGFSVCWRMLDAQYWGVPQRRKRIYLVADFNGECASEILFESEGMSGYSAESFRAWQETAGNTGKSSFKTGGYNVTAGFCSEQSEKTKVVGYEKEKSPTLQVETVPATAASLGADGYNGEITGDISSTLSVNCGMSSGRNGVIMLNDQGGKQMDVSEDNVSTLRAEAHHPPVVLENHPADSRVKIREGGVIQTLSSRMGTGGGNTPLIMQNPVIFVKKGRPRSSEEIPKWEKGDIANTLNTFDLGDVRSNELIVETDEGKTSFLDAALSRIEHLENAEIWVKAFGGSSEAVSYERQVIPFAQNQRNEVRELGEKSGAVTAAAGSKGKTYIAVAYGISSKDSNAMKSQNPYSGIYKAKTSRTLDGNGGNPACNQGGIAVVALEGNGSRPSHYGNGYSADDISYTLNTTEHHGVAYNDRIFSIDRESFNCGKNFNEKPARNPLPLQAAG